MSPVCRRFSATLLITYISLSGAAFISPVAAQPTEKMDRFESFYHEVFDLKTRLGVPGLAYVIIKDGEVLANREMGFEDAESETPYSSTTLQDIASIAKIFVASLLLKLEEDGQINLSDPVIQYDRTLDVPPEVTIGHILTHTSEGLIGQEFVYGSTRFGMLVNVIEGATNRPFEDVLYELILRPAGMKLHPSPAGPSSMWMFSTLQDMTKYVQALDSGVLLNSRALARLITPSRNRDGHVLPVSLGWFTQEFKGERVMWSYGQDDTAGGLLLRVPGRGISLYLQANSGVLSDPFRLLMANVERSPLAHSFMRLFVFSGEELIPQPDFQSASLIDELEEIEKTHSYTFESELLAQAPLFSFTGNQDQAALMYQVVRDRYAINESSDIVSHFYFAEFMDDVFLDAGIEMGNSLLIRHPNNRWILDSQAMLFARAGKKDQAIMLYEHILELPNQQKDRLHHRFGCWTKLPLAKLLVESNLDRAKKYLSEIMEDPLGCYNSEDAAALLGRW